MKRIFKYTLIIAVSAALAFGGYCLYKYLSGPEHAISPHNEKLTGRLTLDHDINVWDDTYMVYDGYKTGFDVTVGPTGWPVGSNLKWEVALFRTDDAYYARLILHEYMLWWSWDDPYLLVKIPKKYVSGDPVNDEKFRWNMLWDITYATGRSYNYSPYIPNAKIREINGHTVSFGYYVFSYYKYLVISDADLDW